MTVRPRLQHPQIVKIARLMDMLYKPAELAIELDTTADTIVRTWIPAGLPVIADSRGHKWINGNACTEWIKSQLAAKHKTQMRKNMKEGHAYCLKCKNIVPLINPKVKPINRYIELLQAPCPKCGCTTNRVRGIKKHSKK